MCGAELERHIFYLRSVSQYAANEWSKSFAKSILKQSRKRGWQPSEKQCRHMRRLVSELFEPEAVVIDE